MALVVTIVVLLILVGITVVYVFGDNSVFKQASEAKLKTDIANWQERLELAKSSVFIEGLGTFNPDKYFDYIQGQGIINSKDTDVIDNGDGSYDITTKPGYVFLVTLVPNKEKPTDAEIEYIGQVGKIIPIIKRLDVSATSTSITGKAVVARLGNGTIEYYYKFTSAADSTYQKITNVNEETGATQSTEITAGESYTIKVVAKNDVGEVEKTAEITATEVFVESIILNKTEETVVEGRIVTLKATVKPDNSTNKNVTWESSDTSIATVSDSGVVTGKTEGTATITVKSTDGSDTSATCTVIVKLLTISDIVGEEQEDTITVKDKNENKVVIPGGFRVLPHGTKNDDIDEVIYNYDANHSPCVQDGIVIADSEDNQFVWIPIKEIKNKAEDVNGATSNIQLGRYEFASNGTPNLKQDAETKLWDSVLIDSYFRETTSTKNLGTFVSKTLSNRGYYLARYEASGGMGDNTSSKVKSQYNKTVWVNITKANAHNVGYAMYDSHPNVSSGLINSYAWDTAIVFIQLYSSISNYASNNLGYSIGEEKQNTGTVGDKVCNIHDLACNCTEWSTEYSDYVSNPGTPGQVAYSCVLRGGSFRKNGYFAKDRGSTITTTASEHYTFRPILYVIK